MTKQTPGSLLLVAAIAGGAAFVAFVALLIVGNFTVSPAGFLAGVVALATAVVLFQRFHRDSDPKDRPNRAPRPGDRSFEDRTVSPGTAGIAPGAAGVETGSAGRPAGAAAGTTTFSNADDEKPSTAAVAPGPQSAGVQAGNAPTDMPTGRSDVGSGDLSAHQVDSSEGSEINSHPVETPSAETPRAGADAQTNAPKVRSGTLLKGEEDLAVRKGSWRYERVARSDQPAADETHHDGHGESAIGVEPVRLSEARDGGPDDLKRIKGVGPKLEEILHRLGVYHYDQIAAWTEKEVLWVDEHLEGFKGRVSRDDWIAQARRLVAGVEPEQPSATNEHDATS